MAEQSGQLAEQVDLVAAQHQQQFGAPPRWIAAAPGRVNLIGEHTDYNDGFVLPMAIERYTVLAASSGADPQGGIEVYAAQLDDRQLLRLRDPSAAALPPWTRFLRGVFELLADRGMATGPLQVTVSSAVPLGSGLSSSAALEVATATLVEAVTGQTLDGRDKARLCQKVEHEYVGMPCGIMDQFSSALCREGEAMRLDCRSLETTPVPLTDPNVAVLITNSRVKHELTGSEYPTRRAQCEAAAAALGVKSLRDASLSMFEASRGSLDDVQLKRARHVIGEIQRVLEFSAAAEKGNWEEAGQLMYASHDSLRDDYEVSCPEVDKLVEIARGMGLPAGVYGSRITGGGFGGCTVTLCRADQADAIAAKLLADYQTACGVAGESFVSRPARGAHVVRG